MNNLISVIVPVYNTERYLYRCVDSIKNQSYTNFELILINDGSSDSSLLMCKELAQSDSRIVVCDRPNGGASAARNTGLSVAKGDYFVFIDSDDYVSPDYLNNLLLAAKQKDYDIVQCNIQKVNEVKKQIGNALFRDSDVVEITKAQALNKRLYKVSVCGKIYKKELFNSFNFREGIIYEDDASYYIFVDKANRLGLLNESLYYYFMSDNSVMRNNKKDKSTEFIEIYKDRIKYFSERNNKELLDGTYSRFCLVLMLFYSGSMVNGNNRNERSLFLNIFKTHYSKVVKSQYVSVKDKIMFGIFIVCPQIIGRIIGRLRG